MTVDDPTSALGELFAQNRGRLRAMIQLRLDARLRSRIDPSDVLQEAFVEIVRRTDHFLATTNVPPIVWMRAVTLEQMQHLVRRHLNAQARAVGRELHIERAEWGHETSAILAGELVAKLSSPSQAAIRAEQQIQLQLAIATLDPVDQEIIALRCYEELTNAETAAVLQLQPSAASNRYVRALKRLKDILDRFPTSDCN